MDFQKFIRIKFLRNEILTWGTAIGVALAIVAVLLVFRWLLRGRLAKRAARTKSLIDDAIVHVLGATQIWFILVVGLWTGSGLITWPRAWNPWFPLTMKIVTLLQGAIWLTVALSWYLKQRYGDHVDPAERTGVTLLRFMGIVVVWCVVLLGVFTSVGVDVTAVVAGLGVGGIAVALALQSILGDVFASVSIVLDKPFMVGDFIVLGEEKGTVEQIGLKTTRLRSLDGEEISFANNDILNSRIRNYKRMNERRVLFRVGVTYDTPVDKIDAITDRIRDIISADARVRLDRVHLADFGSFSLDFEIVYWVLASDYTLHMQIRHDFNRAILEGFQAEGISFAFPTQTLHMPDARDAWAARAAPNDREESSRRDDRRPIRE